MSRQDHAVNIHDIDSIQPQPIIIGLHHSDGIHRKKNQTTYIHYLYTIIYIILHKFTLKLFSIRCMDPVQAEFETKLGDAFIENCKLP